MYWTDRLRHTHTHSHTLYVGLMCRPLLQSEGEAGEEHPQKVTLRPHSPQPLMPGSLMPTQPRISLIKAYQWSTCVCVCLWISLCACVRVRFVFQNLRVLENRLEKAQLKCQEAEHIMRGYLKLKAHLQVSHPH